MLLRVYHPTLLLCVGLAWMLSYALSRHLRLRSLQLALCATMRTKVVISEPPLLYILPERPLMQMGQRLNPADHIHWSKSTWWTSCVASTVLFGSGEDNVHNLCFQQ